MECKVRDVVHVRMEVVKDGWNLSVDAAVDGQIVTVPKTAIVHVEPRPRPITVGDVVRHQSCGWVVKGVEGDNLWLRRGYDGVYKAVFRSEVQPSSSGK